MIDSNIEFILRDTNSTVAQVMAAVNSGMKSASPAKQVKLGVSASSVVNLLELFLRRYGLLNEVSVEVLTGNYDDPVGDIDQFALQGADYVVLLPFLDALWPGFEARLADTPSDLLEQKLVDIADRFNLVFNKAAGFKLVLVGQFHRISERHSESDDIVDLIVGRLNEMLRSIATRYSNVKFIDIATIIGDIGRSRSLDFRFYFRNRAPYSPALLDRMAKTIFDLSRGLGSYFYKALVIDCDNTLWGGVIGEDLLAGVKLSPHDYPGNIFWRIQHDISRLEKGGVLLCLCSKNNESDVDQMFDHPEMVLKRDQIAIRKVNWRPKPENISEISKELSIGLDSLIFLDDSEFEIEAVRSALPMVRTFRVPTSLDQYPKIMGEIRRLCLGGGVSKESESKTSQYRIRAEAEALKLSSASHEDYLRSLEIKVKLTRGDVSKLARISELTQKSNQFNLTTVRYTETEIGQIMSNSESEVFSLAVSDRFGSSGLTGVVVIRYVATTVHVEAFLMSCRVIGRGVEFAVWSSILDHVRRLGFEELNASFRATSKNQQVADFYDRLGLKCVDVGDDYRLYSAEISTFMPNRPNWIEVEYVG